MANLLDVPYQLNTLIGPDATAGIGTGFALNDDLVFLTSGPCVGCRFLAPPGGVHLDYAYFFLHAADDPAQNLTAYLSGAGAAITYPGAAIRSVTLSGGTAADKWLKFDFTAYTDALTFGDHYWVTVGDTAGAGDTYQIRSRSTGMLNSDSQEIRFFTSANGFSAAGTLVAYPSSVILVFSDGTVLGNPYTERVLNTSNTLERGVKITGLTEQLKIAGIFLVDVSSNISTVQILASATAPGGAVWAGFNGGAVQTLTATQKTAGQIIRFPSVVTLAKDTTYRLTLRYTGNTGAPAYSNVEDAAVPGAHATSCSFMQGRFCHTIDDGGGGWTDTVTQLPGIGLIVHDQVAVAAGGGGVNMPRTRIGH